MNLKNSKHLFIYSLTIFYWKILNIWEKIKFFKLFQKNWKISFFCWKNICFFFFWIVHSKKMNKCFFFSFYCIMNFNRKYFLNMLFFFFSKKTIMNINFWKIVNFLKTFYGIIWELFVIEKLFMNSMGGLMFECINDFQFLNKFVVLICTLFSFICWIGLPIKSQNQSNKWTKINQEFQTIHSI